MMKNLLFSFTLLTVFSLATVANTNNTNIEPWACEHCAKDHTCDDKCKKGEKSDCCDKAKANNQDAAVKENKSCCQKGHKSCKSADKKEKKETKDTDNKS